MDEKTGDIYDLEAIKARKKLMKSMCVRAENLKEMIIPPTVVQLKRKPIDPSAIGRVGRNELCPCGSGKKFKQCCLIL